MFGNMFLEIDYRVRQCYCHPLYKPFFKHQQKCRTKIPLKNLPGIWKSSLKISRKEIGKNFSVFSVIRFFFKFCICLVKIHEFRNRFHPMIYQCSEPEKRWFCHFQTFGSSWILLEGSFWGQSYINSLLAPMSWY